MVNSPLSKALFLGGGGIGGVPLDSHDYGIMACGWHPYDKQNSRGTSISNPSTPTDSKPLTKWYEVSTSNHLSLEPKRKTIPTKLVGGFNQFEKYARQSGSFPQVGAKRKNIRNHQPEKKHRPNHLKYFSTSG